MDSRANQTQVGGEHYKTSFEHWDYVWANKLDYFQGQITKYVTRWRQKNGLEDLYKARHFLQKYIELLEKETAEKSELESSRTDGAGPAYVDQDRGGKSVSGRTLPAERNPFR